MDIASLVGILGAIGLIVVAMTAGGSINTFIDVPSVQIDWNVSWPCSDAWKYG